MLRDTVIKMKMSDCRNVVRGFLLLSLLWMVAQTAEARMLDESVAKSDMSPGSLAQDVAQTALALWNETWPGGKQWNYQRGTLLVGLQRVYLAGGCDACFDLIRRDTENRILENGTILTYNLTNYVLDSVLPGRTVLFLWKQTGQHKFRKAADLLRSQLRTHPRTKEGGFWHKLIYPYQMWLDGLYMAEPFYAEYAATFDQPEDFDDIAKQFMLVNKHLRDSKTGLFYHGYDESRAQNWSNPKTGDSESFWGRADGWFCMALVDTLDYFPLHHSKRGHLVTILQGLVKAIRRVQDPSSGVWWEVLNFGGREGNYLEGSASAMFVYTIAKAVRMGYISDTYYKVAETGYKGIVKQFIGEGPNGRVDFTGTVITGGLGGHPFSNGSYAYYLSQPVVTNDPKGMGPFLMASIEIESSCKSR